MSETTVGREPIQIVEIKQPRCSLTYGVSPCTASGSAGEECFNTLSTCQDEANYSASTLSLYFSSGKVPEKWPQWDFTQYKEPKSIIAPGPFPAGLYFSPDGIHMYVSDASDDLIYQYELSVPWDLLSATNTGRTLSAALDDPPGKTSASPQAFYISADGVNAFFLGQGFDRIYKYTLGTPWMIDTATFVENSATVSAAPTGLWFSPDGTIVFIADSFLNQVTAYSLSAPWDVTPLTSLGSVNTGPDPSGVSFASDGLTMYVTDFTEDSIRVYKLTTAWDITTATYSHLFSVWAPSGAKFSTDGFIQPTGNVFYVTDVSTTSEDRIYQFELPAPAVQGPAYVIPSLISVSTSPTKINLAGANPDAEGLGNRALCTLVFNDHPHTDRVVDPYVETRGYDGLTKGSFWTKWKARNKYRQQIEIAVYEGYAGQTLAEMKKRVYFFDSIQGPDDSGRVTIQGKDILARLEERKAQAPLASPGVLYTAINNSQTSFEVARAVVADYPSSGTLRIDSEVMTYTSRSSSANGVTFSGVTRGTDNTAAASHSVDALVQLCLRISNARIDDTLELLLETYGNISASYLDLTNWAEEVNSYLSLWRLNALITVPTAVTQLVSEIQEQTQSFCWWDEREAKVKFKAVRGIDAVPLTYTAESHIIAGSFRLSEKPRERVSQVWVYYRQFDPTKSVTDEANYSNAFIVTNLTEEARYGEPSIRKIFARWLTSGSLAETTASKLITRFIEVPTQAVLRMDAKDRTVWTGDVIRLSHPLDVDEFGERRIRQWLVLSAEEIEPSETVEYVVEDITLYGGISFIMAAGTPDYPGYELAPDKNCYIGDASGLLSDGQRAGRIS